ncbi:MAG TPA: chemotaxis protein CheW [Rhodopila sp.]
MLFLLFRLDADWYALDASAVDEVLPLTQLKQIPQAPAGVAGLFNLRGTPVPAIDLSLLALGRPSRAVRSTRILLIRGSDRFGSARPFGLIAEHATETLKRSPSDFIEAGIRSDGAPYLGPVVQDTRGLVQWIAADRLLSEPLREALFQGPTTA